MATCRKQLLSAMACSVMGGFLLLHALCSASLDSDANPTDYAPSISPFDIPPRNFVASLEGAAHLRASDVSVDRPQKAQSDRIVKANPEAPSTPQERKAFEAERSRRIKERRERARAKIRAIRPQLGSAAPLTMSQLDRILEQARETDPNLEKPEHRWLKENAPGSTANDGQRRTGWFSRGDYTPAATATFLADWTQTYDRWAQGYRMLGAYIDCDFSGQNKDEHKEGEGEEKDENRDGNNNKNRLLNNKNANEGGNGCARWMLWAAYVNPNYAGGGRDEYFANSSGYYSQSNYYNVDNPYYTSDAATTSGESKLDCHHQNTQWQLMGVYRQEFYQFLEQISKHLWAVDDYNYVCALAGLYHMGNSNCYQIGYSSSGTTLYAGPQPLSDGYFQMSLYTDDQCLTLDTKSGYTYNTFVSTSKLDLNSGDPYGDDDNNNNDAYQQAYSTWQSCQEYTLTLMNEIYDDYKYCTLCMDYPTYQDGYFIGDYGTDDDDMINQCWKFHSHSSYTCESDCLAMADAQGTIVRVNYGGATFGSKWDGSYAETLYNPVNKEYSAKKTGSHQRIEKLKANIFVSLSGILFVATFLAFAVARGGGSSKKKSDKTRSLLSDEERRLAKSGKSSSGAPSKKSRSKSRTKSSTGDRERSRSKSGDTRKKRSVSAERNRLNAKFNSVDDERSHISNLSKLRPVDVESVTTTDREKRKKSRSKSKSESKSSRRHIDDF